MLGKPWGPRRQAWVDLEGETQRKISGEAEPPRPILKVAQLHPAYKEVIFCGKAGSNHNEEGIQEESQGQGASDWTHSNVCRVGTEPQEVGSATRIALW